MQKQKKQTDIETKRLQTPPVPPVEEAPAVATTAGVVYSFPTVARCPRCGSLATRRRADHGGTQYRECKAPICGKKFAIKGTPV